MMASGEFIQAVLLAEQGAYCAGLRIASVRFKDPAVLTWWHEVWHFQERCVHMFRGIRFYGPQS